MSLTYWTTLVEPKRCKIDPYGCQYDEYDKYLEGKFLLENVKVEKWAKEYSQKSGKDQVEMRLGMFKDIDEVYDILKFNYEWSRDLSGKWYCDDGYALDEGGKGHLPIP